LRSFAEPLRYLNNKKGKEENVGITNEESLSLTEKKLLTEIEIKKKQGRTKIDE